jgi:hypothetical protein
MTVVGFLISQYIGVTTLSNDITTLKTTVKTLDERFYDIQLFIMSERNNRKIKKNSERDRMTGKRKFTAWVIAMIMNAFVFGLAIAFNVKFTSDSITTIIMINSTLTGAFFGANFGEHWTKSKTTEKSS